MHEMFQEFITPRFMVSIKFAVCGDQYQLCLSTQTFARYKVFGQVAGREEVGVVGGIPIEGDSTGQGGIVEEDGDAASIQQAHNVRLGGIYRCSGLPGSQ